MTIVVWGCGPAGRGVQRMLARGEQTPRAVELAIFVGGLPPAEWLQDEWAVEIDAHQADDVDAATRHDPAVLGWVVVSVQQE